MEMMFAMETVRKAGDEESWLASRRRRQELKMGKQFVCLFWICTNRKQQVVILNLEMYELGLSFNFSGEKWFENHHFTNCLPVWLQNLLLNHLLNLFFGCYTTVFTFVVKRDREWINSRGSSTYIQIRTANVWSMVKLCRRRKVASRHENRFLKNFLWRDRTNTGFREPLVEMSINFK